MINEELPFLELPVCGDCIGFLLEEAKPDCFASPST